MANLFGSGKLAALITSVFSFPKLSSTREGRLHMELLFRITQPNALIVNLKASISFSINKCDEEAIKNDPFRKVNEQNLRVTVANTLQNNLVQLFTTQSPAVSLNLDEETLDQMKSSVRRILHSWGYKLRSLRVKEFNPTDADDLTVISEIEVKSALDPLDSTEAKPQSILVDADVNILISRLEDKGASILGQYQHGDATITDGWKKAI